MDSLKWLEQWYASISDDEWKDYYGITIRTLDNPGWSVEIDIAETPLDGKPFPAVNSDLGEDDWVFCKVENNKFVGVGDKSKLYYIINAFKAWSSCDQ